MTIDKNFDPAAIEKKWYAHWENTGAFRPERPAAEPFTIVNPPPNVTGSLHIGHALDNTLQDILIRHARLLGKDALWVVGTDHAGIATQMVVERQLNAKGQTKFDFGTETKSQRDGFIEKIWEWKNESGGEITGQLRRLGCSMDWSHEQFTMDPHFSKAVTKAFVDLYDNKDAEENPAPLIYRDKRLVNWDPGLKTAISDLEVETREINGKFWHFRYPLADGVTTADGKDYIVVATTRPETMLADMAVAVNASDERYASVVGQHIILPITGRRIPIITDDHADPELGSGAVKITPGHDFNDFGVGKRAGFKASDMLNMLDGDGRVVQIYTESMEWSDANYGDDDNPDIENEPHPVLTPTIPEDYIGLYRFGIEGEATNARRMVVEAIDALGLLEKVEDRVIQTPFGDRSGQVIEPWLTDQWYVDAETLAQPAIEAARKGAANGGFDIVPKSWEKTYFNWMENIQPWCVSRQLWWGHRIPAWYGPPSGTDQEVQTFVAEDFAGAVRLAQDYYPVGTTINEARDDQNVESQNTFAHFTPLQVIWLKRDQDVLDTWFSSALWPFGTLGWPEENPSPLAGEERDLARNEPSRSGEGAFAETEDTGLQTQADPSPQPSPARGEGTSLLNRHYPGDVLISGFDILFFWDARMAMQGLHFMKDVPWKTLYLHGLVRAADGSKMSKSKGNSVDPIGLIDEYGADALRFFMAAMESQGRDIKMDEGRVAGYRNFATKLWNAARFAQSNGIGGSHSVSAPKAELAVNRWIIGEVAETVAKLNKAFAEFRFDGMADVIYHFVWDQFCDWYLELIKPVLSPLPFRGGAGGGVSQSGTAFVEKPHPNPSPEGEGLDPATETRIVAGWVLDQILVMLHPFMPFITEELWHSMADPGQPRKYDIIHAKWPQPKAEVDTEAAREINWLIRIVSDIRSARAEANVPPSEKMTLAVRGAPEHVHGWIQGNYEALKRLARLDMVTSDPIPTEGSVVVTHADATYLLPLEGVIDLDAERARITKAMEAAVKERDALAGRLSNAAFVERAKPEAVKKARADMAEKAAEAERLSAALARVTGK